MFKTEFEKIILIYFIIYFKNFFYEFKINKKNYIINIKNIKKINLIYV